MRIATAWGRLRRSKYTGAMMLLAAVAVLSLVAAAGQFVVLTNNESQLVDRRSDSTRWMASQFRSEILQLHIAVASFDGSPAQRADVQQHLEILYGRVALMTESTLAPAPDAVMRRAIDAVIVGVLALGGRLEALQTQGATDLRLLSGDLRALERAAGRMTTLSAQADAEYREAVRRAIWRANLVFGVAALLLLGSLLLSLRAVDRQAAGLDMARRRSEKLSQDLAAALALAQAGARAKNVFLATMSHEIRTPMNGVLGAASLLSHTALADDQRRWVDIVRACGETLLAQLDDVLDFSALEAAATRLQLDTFDIRALAEDTARVVENAANDQGLGFVVVIDPDVPARLVSDRRRLGQVLLNLVTNAVKFTASGGVLVRLSLRRRGGTAWLRVAVVDTGPGIPRADRGRIFQEFTRLDRVPERTVRGTGLGLAISLRIAAALGGRVGVTAAPGCGCVFLFSVPVGVPDDPGAAAPAPAPRGAAAPALAPRGTAVVLGASVPVRNGIVRLLAAEGYRLASSTAVSADVLLHHAGLTETATMPAARHTLGFGPGTLLEAPITAARLHAALAGRSARRAVALPPAPRASRPLCLLVADDDAINREIAASLLRHLGHDVATAADGQQALAAVQAAAYDCVMLDLHMPRMDGADLARAIRALPAPGGSLRLVAVTADADPGMREAALAAGIDAVLTKPVTLERLADALRPLAAHALAAHALAAGPAATLEPMRAALAQRLTPERLTALIATFWDGVARALEAPHGLAEGGLAEGWAAGQGLERWMHTLAGSAGSLGYGDVPPAARQVRDAARRGAGIADAMDMLYDTLAAALDSDRDVVPAAGMARVTAGLAAARAARRAAPRTPAVLADAAGREPRGGVA